jgi:hypothetical protein
VVVLVLSGLVAVTTALTNIAIRPAATARRIATISRPPACRFALAHLTMHSGVRSRQAQSA